MAKKIEVAQNNNITVTCTVKKGLTSLSGYTAVMTVKEKVSDSAGVFTVTGTTFEMVATFELLPIHTDRVAKTYYYDVTISNGIKIYTIAQDVLVINER